MIKSKNTLRSKTRDVILHTTDVTFNSTIKVESVFTPSTKVKLDGKVVYGEKGITINEIMDCTESGAYIKDTQGNTLLWGDAAVTGLKLILADGTEYTVSIRGDLDGDGDLKAADARLALRASVSLEKLTDAQKKSADMDADGTVKAGDARIILRLSVGLPEQAPPKEPEKPKLTISAADYSYLAGNDFRRVRRQYSTARATGGYVYAFVNTDGDQCILTVVQYRIQSIYYETTLHNITKSTTVTDPENYYDRLANSAYGANKINYMNLKGDVLSAKLACLNGISEGLKSGTSTGTGVFVPASTLNL